MLVADDFDTALNQLVHRAGLGEDVLLELDELVAQLEQAKAVQGFPHWRHDIARTREALMAQLVGLSPTNRHPSPGMAGTVEYREKRFIEASMARLARLLTQPS